MILRIYLYPQVVARENNFKLNTLQIPNFFCIQILNSHFTPLGVEFRKLLFISHIKLYTNRILSLWVQWFGLGIDECVSVSDIFFIYNIYIILSIIMYILIFFSFYKECLFPEVLNPQYSKRQDVQKLKISIIKECAHNINNLKIKWKNKYTYT